MPRYSMTSLLQVNFRLAYLLTCGGRSSDLWEIANPLQIFCFKNSFAYFNLKNYFVKQIVIKKSLFFTAKKYVCGVYVRLNANVLVRVHLSMHSLYAVAL